MNLIAEGRSRQIIDFWLIDAQGAEFLILQKALKGSSLPEFSKRRHDRNCSKSLCMTRLGKQTPHTSGVVPAVLDSCKMGMNHTHRSIAAD